MSKNKTGGYTTLKWLRTKREVSMSWLQKQRKLIGKKYSQDEWDDFVSNTVAVTEGPLLQITEEWSILEREWHIAKLIKKMTKDTKVEDIDDGIDIYFMITFSPSGLFSKQMINRLKECIARLIVNHVDDHDEAVKLMDKHSGLFKSVVGDYIKRQQAYSKKCAK